MPTNVVINEDLLNEAFKIGGLRTKRETVTLALEEFIHRRRQRHVLRSLGTFEFRRDWDYRKCRSK